MKSNEGIDAGDRVSFIVVIAAIIFAVVTLNGHIQNSRSSKMTVDVKNEGKLNGPLITVSYPAVTFFDGGQNNQVYVFSSNSGNRDDWQLEYALNEKNGFIGDAVDQRYHLVMCAPKALPEDQLLRYMWLRDNAEVKNVIWKGIDNLPRSVDVPCE